jgi:hypothetical protein
MHRRVIAGHAKACRSCSPFPEDGNPEPEYWRTERSTSGRDDEAWETIRHLGSGRARGGIRRWSPNFGAGFQAAQERPIQMASLRNNLAQQEAQTALTRQQATMVQTPYGPLPAGLAKAMFPALINAGSREKVQGMKGSTAESIQGQKSETAENVAGTAAGARTGAAEIGAGARVKAAQIGQGMMVDVPQDLQDQFGAPPKLPLTQLNKLESAANRPLTVVAGANDSYVVNKRTQKKTPLGVGNRGIGTVLARPVQAADPNNPGQTVYMPAGQAMATGAAGSQSASVQVPKAAMKSEVPTKIGDQKVAFNTMIQHAALLRSAAHALANGDMQTLNGLENKFKNEFGTPGPITAAAIADAYKGEVSNVINKGHITDQGNERIAHTLDPNRQNYAQMDSVLGAYQALAQSKMNMLDKQEQAVINKSQPKKQSVSSAPTPQTHVFDPQAWKSANPQGDINAAIRQAKAQGYQVKQ